MPEERPGAVTLDGTPLTLVGPELKNGDKAPDFKAIAANMSEVTLDASKGKVRLMLSFASLDTSVCDAEGRRFNELAKTFPENVVVYAISCDLPFAQSRWCGAAEIKNVQTLSDHRDVSFGMAYGTLVKEIRQLSRAVFLVDENDTLQYVEYVPEIGQHPDYDAAAEAIRKLTS